MKSFLFKLNSLPEIGFAHHFYTDDYVNDYGVKAHSGFEIVYVKSGKIKVEIYGESFEILPGSVFILFRTLPFHLCSADNLPQSHCSVQLVADHEVLMIDSDDTLESVSDVVLPMVMPPSAESEKIYKELCEIISERSISRTGDSLSSVLAAMGILSRFERMGRKITVKKFRRSSFISFNVKKYVAEHLAEPICLSEIAEEMDKSPNYINSVFKSENGITICRYINSEKVKLIAELMKNKGASFETACENVAIYDISYGYRLFKKYMGSTPKEYLATEFVSG